MVRSRDTTDRRPVTLAIVDDHRMVLDGLRSWLRDRAADIEIPIATVRWAELVEHPAFPVDVVLLDLGLDDGIPAPVKITMLAAAGVETVVISTLADPDVVRSCLRAGAASYVPKSEAAEEIVHAVRAAARGERYTGRALAAALMERADGADGGPAAAELSPQEVRVLVLYASGLPLKSVARTLGISFDTAKCYLDRVRDKYAAAGRAARTKLELHQRALEDHLLLSR